MSENGRKRLVFCYIHGLDRRRICEADAPFLNSLLARGDNAIVETIPTNELVSTVFTGVWPHEHGIWQASLRPAAERSAWNRIVDALPDVLTTAAQLVRFQFDKSYDLPAVPPRRRRRMRLHRFKYFGWSQGGDKLRGVGGCQTLFDGLGDTYRYHFAKDMTGTRDILAAVPSSDVDVDFFQTYGFDQVEHWALDRPDVVARALRQLDGWLAEAATRCAEQHVPMLIFSDHGQEPVRGYVDLKDYVRRLGVSDDDCTYLIEAQCARFWFHRDGVRDAVVSALGALEHTRIVRNKDLAAFGLHFEDESYGELYLYTDQGYTFFPHDFYHPLANLVMGWREREVMSPRLRDPRHRGYHGHLPPHPAEEGLLVMTMPGWRRNKERARLIDIAPTILSLVGRSPAQTMKGSTVFEREPAMV